MTSHRIRPVPVVAPAVLTAALCLSLCMAVRSYGARLPAAPVRVVSCLRQLAPAPVVTGVPPSRGGRDVVGRKMPPLEFERWVKAEPDEEAPGRAAARVTLYRWWTDGCPHCEKTLPAVERLRREYAPRGLRVVAVYHPKPPRDVSDEAVLRAARAAGYHGAVALDQDWSELKKFYLDTGDRPATSASFVVGADGVVRFVHPGPRFYPSDDPAESQENADYQSIEKAVAALLGAG